MIYRSGLVLLLAFLLQTALCAEIPYPADFQGKKLNSFTDATVWAFDFQSIQPTEQQIQQGIEAGDMFCQYVWAENQRFEYQNELKALALLEKSGAQGFGPALFQLGCIYEAGVVKYEQKEGEPNCFYPVGEWISPDFSKAFAYYQSAAQAGSPDAQYRLGLFFLNGLTVEKNPVRAEELFRLAAKGGEKNAVNWVQMRDAQLKIDALPPDQRDAAALLEFAQVQKERYIEKAQSENDSISQRFISRDAEFLDAFERAAEAGSAPAQYVYGILLTKIDPVSPDEQENKFFIHQILCSCMSDCSFDDENAQKGLKYVRKSAEQGFPPAELALGIFLLNGIGFENGKADPEAGFQQILKVAEAEKAEKAEKETDEQNSNAFEDSDWTKFPACTIAGFCCALGVGMEPNEEKAFELLETSMGLESPAEMDVEVARRLKVGSAERLKWLFKAVQNGWESRSGYEKNELYYELAVGLIRGDRIPRDDELAYRLLCELGSNGDDMILALRAVCCSMGWGTKQDETKAQALWASAVKKYREESAAFESSDDAALQQYFTILKANYCLCRGETELAGKLLLETENGTNTEENVTYLPKGHEMPVPWVQYSWKNGLFLNVESYGSRIVSPTENFRVDEAATAEAEKADEPLNLSEERFQQGLRYFNGQDVEKDETRGRALIEQAAKAGNAPAGNWLWLHNALDRLEKACETGDADALYERGALIRMVYLKELKDSDSSNPAEPYARFVEDFELSAKKGNAAAQYEFAFVRLGLYPKRTEKNQFFAETPTETARTEALELLRQSAEKGFVPAMLALGIHALKSGDSAKVKDGFQRIQKASEAGNETACEVLAFCFLTGLGTEPDETKALEALKKINDEFDTQKMYLFLLSKLIDDPRRGFHLLPWIDKAFEAGYDDSDGTIRK